MRALDAAPQDDKLLTEERILSDEFRFAPHQIGQCADDEWSSGWFRGDEEAVVQRLHDGTSCTREIPQQANEHKRVLLEMGDDHRQWTSDVSRRISILATSLPLKKACKTCQLCSLSLADAAVRQRSWYGRTNRPAQLHIAF